MTDTGVDGLIYNGVTDWLYEGDPIRLMNRLMITAAGLQQELHAFIKTTNMFLVK